MRSSIEADPTNASPMANYAILLDHMDQVRIGPALPSRMARHCRPACATLPVAQVDKAEEYYRLALATDKTNPMHCFHYATFLKTRRDDEQRAAYYTLFGQQLSKHGGADEFALAEHDESLLNDATLLHARTEDHTEK